MAALVLVSIFGALGYLVIGWVATVVCAASMSTDDATTGGQKASAFWWWNLVLWPVILAGCRVIWLLVNGGERLSALSLRLVQRLNPEIKRWY